MFIQFLDLYGNPVWLRPELVVGMRGLSRPARPSDDQATAVHMTSAAIFEVKGHPDTISEAITRAEADQMLSDEIETAERNHRAPAWAARAERGAAQRHADCVATMDINGSHVGRSFHVHSVDGQTVSVDQNGHVISSHPADMTGELKVDRMAEPYVTYPGATF